MDQRATEEMVRAIVTSLRSSFSAAVIPDSIVLRETHGHDKALFNKHLVVVGASNARNLIPALQGVGFTITDMTEPGWIATESNIEKMITQLQTIDLPGGFGIVLDLLGNCTFRFEQFDGTLSLPYKDSTGYHMAGSITVCPDTVFKKIILALSPILLSAQQNLKVIVPPLPRYLSNGCCKNPAHSTNVKDSDFVSNTLVKVTHLRSILKKELVTLGVKNFWLLDGVASLLGIPPSKKRDGNKEEADMVTGINRGVHYTSLGYANMATVIRDAFVGLAENTLKHNDPLSSLTGGASSASAKTANYYWRGFSSPVGAPGPPRLMKQPKSHYGSNRAHPYHKKK
jgi:hypothetical protein